MTDSRVSQEVTEVLYEIDPKAKITQEVTEVLYEIDPKAKITQEVAEYIATYNFPARLSQIVIEVIYIPMPLDYGLCFMRAWDSVNDNFVYWLTTTPPENPTTTNPQFSAISNLVSRTIIVHFNDVPEGLVL